MKTLVRLDKGMNLNSSFEDQPKGTYRYAQNAVIEEDNGELALTTERGKELQFTFDFGGTEDSAYVIIGSQEVDDNNTVLFLTNDISGDDIIALHNDTGTTVLIEDNMDFNFNNKIDTVYRLRKGCDRTIYFTDGLNPPRVINIDDIPSYYDGTTLELNRFNLFQKGDLAVEFTSIEEIEGGSLKPGSYNFAIQYLDKDFNSFEFFIVSEPVNIYNDNKSKTYGSIHGSTSKKSDYQDYGDTNKAIQIELGSLDTDFPFYRVAVIKSNTGTGIINEVGYSNIINTNNTTFVYSDDTKLFEGSLIEVQQFTNYIATAKHIDTVDNILLLANTTGPDINFGLLQKYATGIRVELVTENRRVNSLDKPSSIDGYGPKRSNIKTDEVTYQFGELYSLGIVYVFKDGYESPVFHIPGQGATSTANMSTDNELQVTYSDKGACQDYWGTDFEGNAILNQPVRHHRIPTKQELGLDVVTGNAIRTTDVATLSLSNIVMPSIFEVPLVIGYYIVQAKREEADKLVLDSAILIPTIENVAGDTIAHHVLNNSFTSVPIGDVGRYSKRLFAMINPQFKFIGKSYTNFNIKHEGYYTISDFSLDENKIEDAQAGTSYDPGIHKRRSRDSDGFTLHTLTRDIRLTYTFAPTPHIFTTDEVFYLNTLESRTLDTVAKDVYNLSSDNKVGFVYLDQDFDMAIEGRKYPYVLLTKPLLNQYSDFETRPYYRVNKTMQPALNNTVNTFVATGGDSFISSMSYSSSVFNDIVIDPSRRQKKGVFNFIIGGLALIAGSALALTGVGVLPAIAVLSFGVSQLGSGLSKVNAAKVYGDLHDNTLKDTIFDLQISNQFDVLTPGFDDGVPDSGFDGTTDDEIQWFMDTLSNVYFESQINIELRIGTNLGGSDFINSPSRYYKGRNTTHLIDKLTVVNQDNTDGRAYLGFCRAEIYDINLDYQRFEREKIYFALDNTFDFCGLCTEQFPHRIYKSNQSFDEESFDNFRVFAPNNYTDISGEGGEITDIFIMQNNIYIHTEKILWHLPQNFQERVTSEIISFLGTGDYFSIPPRRIMDAEGFSAGLSIDHKWTNVKTPYGVFFLSHGEGKWYSFNGSNIKPITSDIYFRFRELLEEGTESYLYHSVYDREFERVVLTKFGIGTTDNEWTLSYSLKRTSITGFHSHIPNFYFNTRGGLYSTLGQDINDFTEIYKHNIQHTFLNLNGVQEEFIIDIIAVNDPINNVTWEDVRIHSDSENWNNVLEGYLSKDITFDTVEFYTKTQYSGVANLIIKEVESFFNNYVINYPDINVDKNEGIYKVNMIRDYIVNHNQPIILNSTIIPTLNLADVSYTKNWSDIELIRDKYLGVRLKFNTFIDVKLSLDTLELSSIPSKT